MQQIAPEVVFHFLCTKRGDIQKQLELTDSYFPEIYQIGILALFMMGLKAPFLSNKDYLEYSKIKEVSSEAIRAIFKELQGKYS